MFPTSPLKGITKGSLVTFCQYAGLGRNGPEYRKATRKVNDLLIFDDHVVVGGGFGTVVNEKNYISHRAKKEA